MRCCAAIREEVVDEADEFKRFFGEVLDHGQTPNAKRRKKT